MKLSNRILSMQSSPIRNLVPFANEAKSKGIDVYHLNIGQPDIHTPKVFFESIHNYDSDVLKYEQSTGNKDLRKSMSDYYKRNGISFEAEDILITNGGSEGLQLSLLATTDHGDNILIPEPFYTNYNGFSLPYGVKIKPITTKPSNGFILPVKREMEKLIDDRTKAILFSNPGNPTGAVYSREEILTLCELAKENELFIIADEVYREFVYDGVYTSMGTIEEVRDRVIIIDSISKRFSACGARIGSIASKNEELIANVLKIAQSRLCVPTLEMIGANSLYKLDPTYFDPIIKEYTERRNVLLEELMKIDGVKCEVPKGAFYAIAVLPVEDSAHFAKWLLTDFSHDGKTVMVAPASGFYATKGLGKNEIRIAYVLKKESLIEAVKLLKIALEEYNSLK